MPKRKLLLIALLTIEAVIIVIHNILEVEPSSMDSWLQEAGWHYWLGLLVGIATVAYAFSLSCSNCGAKQVFRGWSIWDLRWPDTQCWKCNHGIEDADT